MNTASPVERVASNETDWDIVIQRGSPFAVWQCGELWQSRDLLWLFVRRDFVSFYKQTILGPIWFIAQPILTMLAFLFLFGSIANLTTTGVPGPLFYLLGIVCWNLFAECLSKNAATFRENANLFGKVYFPRIILPLSITISACIRFLVQFCLFLIFYLYYWFRGEIHPSQSIVLLPVLLGCLALLGLSAGILFSAMTAKYRDLVYLLQFGVQLLLFLTPVVYAADKVPKKWSIVSQFNPLTPLFEAFRFALFGTGAIDPSGLAYTAIFTVVSFLIGTLVFRWVERSFIDTV